MNLRAQMRTVWLGQVSHPVLSVPVWSSFLLGHRRKEFSLVQEQDMGEGVQNDFLGKNMS